MSSFKNGAFLVLILVAALLFGFIGIPNNVSAVGNVDARITIAQEKMTAHVSPGDDGTVTFTGDVTVEVDWVPSLQYIVVELNADAGGWFTSTPAPLVFSKQSKVQSFAISVQVPSDTLADEERVFRMSGTWTYSPGSNSGECEEDTAMIFVAQYHRIIPSITKVVYEAKAGDIVDIPIHLHNRGNGVDVAYLTDDLTRTMDVSDMEILYPTSEISLPIHANISVTVSVVLYDDVTRGKRNIIFQPISIIAENRGDHQEQGTVTVVIDIKEESLLSKFKGIPLILSITGIIIFIVMVILFIYLKIIRGRKKRMNIA